MDDGGMIPTTKASPDVWVGGFDDFARQIHCDLSLFDMILRPTPLAQDFDRQAEMPSDNALHALNVVCRLVALLDVVSGSIIVTWAFWPLEAEDGIAKARRTPDSIAAALAVREVVSQPFVIRREEYSAATSGVSHAACHPYLSRRSAKSLYALPLVSPIRWRIAGMGISKLSSSAKRSSFA
jgi:hypothetical protein